MDLTKGNGWCRLHAFGPGQEPVAGPFEQGNEPSGSIQGRKFLDQLSNC